MHATCNKPNIKDSDSIFSQSRNNVGLRHMKTNRQWLHRTLFFAGIAMAATGFLLSRSLLSSALILLIANGFLLVPFQQQWQAFKKEPFLWGLSLFFLITFFSGLWSSDTSEWWLRCQFKLPLLLLPFAFASNNSHTDGRTYTWLTTQRVTSQNPRARGHSSLVHPVFNSKIIFSALRPRVQSSQ